MADACTSFVWSRAAPSAAHSGMLHLAQCSVLRLWLLCVMCFVPVTAVSSPVSGHEARQVHRAEFVVEVSQEAEEEGETLATCKVL